LHSNNIVRVRGAAIFLHPTKDTAPLALRANVRHNHVLHDQVLIVSVVSENVPHIARAEQLTVDHLEDAGDGIVHLNIRYGFQDDQNIPETLHLLDRKDPELDIDPETASYFLSRITIRRGDSRGMATWRKRLFIGLSHNAASPAEYFALPEDRTVVMGSRIEL
jgi:KUP system potassium uptake protein